MLAGCHSGAQLPDHVESIQVVGFSGCPNTPEMIYRTKLATIRSGIDATVVYLDQSRLPASDVRRGYPAPSVLVNGHDLFGLAPPREPAMGCRIYPDGLPGTSQIEDRLKAINNAGG